MLSVKRASYESMSLSASQIPRESFQDDFRFREMTSERAEHDPSDNLKFGREARVLRDIQQLASIATGLPGMKIPRADEDSKGLFMSLLPANPHVSTRPMFGNVSAFVNGNMFMGVFGSDLFVRLPPETRQELLKNRGASVLEPAKGKQMKEYVVIPKAWRNQQETLRIWVSRSLDWASKLPAKNVKK